jgi:hypothetical protein
MQPARSPIVVPAEWAEERGGYPAESGDGRRIPAAAEHRIGSVVRPCGRLSLGRRRIESELRARIYCGTELVIGDRQQWRAS